MASRFWVGGTGTWDLASTAHWAATSGGASGASAPVLTDDVFFDGLSGGGTVTISVQQEILSLNTTGFTGTITGNVAVFFNSGGGNLTFGAATTLTLTTYAWHSGVSGTVTTNGVTVPNLQIGGGSSGGTVTLGDACTVSGTVTLFSGTLNTNGKTCNWGVFNSNNANTRTLTLGASAITLTGVGVAWDVQTVTGLTLNAGTSTLTFTGASASMNFGSAVNYNNLVFTGAGTVSLGFIGSTGGCVNFTRTGTASKTDGMQLTSPTPGTLRVSGTLTLTGNSVTNRLNVFSNAVGAQRSITAAVVALTNVDFTDILGAGAASPFAGTSLGDGQGNSGITFDAPVTRFAVAAGNWSSTATWSATSGGAPGATVPLPQDTVKLDAASGAGTYTADMPRIGKDIDFTGFARTFTHASAIVFYGSWTASATMTWNGAGGMTCAARSATTLTTAGKAAPTSLTMNGFGGTLTLQDALAGNSAITLQVTAGTLNLNGKAVSFGSFSAGGGAVARSLVFGSSTLSLIGTGTVWTAAGSGFTVVPGTGVIDITDASATGKTFAGGGLLYPTLRHRAAGAATLTITGNNVFVNLDLETATARSVVLGAGATQYVTGTMTLQGSAGQLLSFSSSQAGNQTVLWVMPGAVLANSFSTISADVVLVTGQNLAMQNVITDAQRTAALSWGTTQQGGSTDGLAVPAGVGVYRQATNLFTRGQCDATAASWGLAVAGTTPSVDATVPAPYSPQSIKYVCDGTGANQGCVAQTAAGQAAAVGTVGVGSIFFKGVAGQAYFAKMRWTNTDATVTDGVQLNFNATGNWQLIVPDSVAVAAAKTGDQLQVMARIAGTRAESNWAAHAMLETNQAYVSPYVATSGGATATRFGSRVQGPSSLLSATQGFVSIRFVTQTPDTGPLGGTGFPVLYEWALDSTTRADILYLESSKKWAYSRRLANVAGADAQSAAQSFAAGSKQTVTGRWTAADNAVATAGGAFAVTADARGITPTQVAFDIGSSIGGNQMNVSVLWFAVGKGPPSTADSAILGAAADHDPNLGSLSAGAAISGVAPFRSSSPAYEVPLALVSSPTLAFA